MGRTHQHRRGRDSALFLNLLSCCLNDSPWDSPRINAHQGDASSPVVEHRRPHLAAVMKPL